MRRYLCRRVFLVSFLCLLSIPYTVSAGSSTNQKGKGGVVVPGKPTKPDGHSASIYCRGHCPKKYKKVSEKCYVKLNPSTKKVTCKGLATCELKSNSGGDIGGAKDVPGNVDPPARKRVKCSFSAS